LANSVFGDDVLVSCVPHPTTGVGHRFAEWNTGLMVARKTGLPFLDAGLGDGWDETFGLTGCFVRTSVHLERHCPAIIRLPFVEWHGRPQALDELVAMGREVAVKTRNAVIMLSDGQNLYRQHDSARELRKFYELRAAGSARTASRGKMRVAVHIRRGDVARMKQQGEGDWRARFVETEWFVAVLAAVVRGLKGLPYEIEIFSQGSPRDFTDFDIFDSSRLCLDADPAWTFHRMATADILIVSPSSFSFSAGLINPGIKFARSPWWHEIPHEDGWHALQGNLVDHDGISSLVGVKIKEWGQE
jgi:hypothetical protein